MVVGRHVARGGDEAALLTDMGVLLAAVEEVGDVGVLLRLGHVQLRDFTIRQHSGQGGGGPLGREGHGVVPLLLVAREGGQAQVECLVQGRSQLARAIGPEVEEQHRVAIANAALLPHERGQHELVAFPTRVGGAHGLLPALGMAAIGLASHHRVDGQACPLPPAVAVHRVITTRHTRHPAARLAQPRLGLGQKARAGVGQRVAAVGEGVEHDVRHLLPPREVDARPQVIHACVHPADGHESQ